MTREIPTSQWTQFFDDLTTMHRAWLAMVDREVAQSVCREPVCSSPSGTVLSSNQRARSYRPMNRALPSVWALSAPSKSPRLSPETSSAGTSTA